MGFKIKYIAVAAVFFATASTFAQSDSAQSPVSKYRAAHEPVTNVKKAGDVGIGFIIGDPNGIMAKLWDSDTTAINGGISFENQNVAASADYLWHFRRAFAARGSEEFHRLNPYIGAGAVVAFPNTDTQANYFHRNNQNLAIAVKVPVGLEFLPRNVPVGVFAEINPGIGIVPDAFSFLQGGAGARYYF